MDDIGSVTSGQSTTKTPITQSGSQGGILQQEDFLEIMIAELSNQDPFEPMDNREFLGQLTEMQNLEASTTMTTTLETLTESLGALTFGQGMATAGSLIGQRVTGFDTLGNEVIGLVTKFSFQDGEAVLGLIGVEGHGSQIDDETVPETSTMRLDRVSEVRGIVIGFGEEEARSEEPPLPEPTEGDPSDPVDPTESPEPNDEGSEP